MRDCRKMVYTSIVLSVLFLAGCGGSSQPTSPPPTLVPKFAYVTNNNPPSISAFRVDASLGALTSVPGSPFAAADSLISIAHDPKGKFVYVTTESLSMGIFFGSISGYSIDSNSGALTAIVGSPFPTIPSPDAVAVHASGNFLYVTHPIFDHFWYGWISAYSIDASTGVLSEIAGSPFQAGREPVSLAQDPSGKFLYAADGVGDQVLAYSIDQLSGLLAPIPGSPFASPSPSSIAVDPAGDFVYVANSVDNTVSAYAINHASGELSAASGSPFGGLAPILSV